MRRIPVSVVFTVLIIANCSPVLGTSTTVKGAGDELLKLRAGPSLEYKVILGLPDGTALKRLNCVTELGQRWCRVALAEASGMTGYVAADYLTD